MKDIDKRIIEFLNEHHVLTLATSVNDQPWTANCFYVYLESENMLVFTSDKTTRHIKDVQENSKVAGSVVLETNVIGKIRGIQFTGTMSEPKEELLKKAGQ